MGTFIGRDGGRWSSRGEGTLVALGPHTLTFTVLPQSHVVEELRLKGWLVSRYPVATLVLVSYLDDELLVVRDSQGRPDVLLRVDEAREPRSSRGLAEVWPANRPPWPSPVPPPWQRTNHRRLPESDIYTGEQGATSKLQGTNYHLCSYNLHVTNCRRTGCRRRRRQRG